MNSKKNILHPELIHKCIKEYILTPLAKRVEADQFHLDVGWLGQKAILNALSENGYADVAYKVGKPIRPGDGG